ncbi:fasciclin domain-containing protein [Puteibacter caeruleilacunae]|nr:fasciclin domain-containing protein [Puteibacter caeruleilacunae]
MILKNLKYYRTLHFKLCNVRIQVLPMIMLCLMVGVMCSCEDTEYGTRFYDEDEQLIVPYLESNENYSECVEALEKADLSGLLSLAGYYTFFAPTNEAFQNYYTQKGVSGLDELSQEEVERMMKNHLVPDTISSVQFTAGALRTRNFLDDNLMVSYGADGLGSIYINEVPLEKIDISLPNGVLHIAGGVIAEVTETLGDKLASHEEYSIFYQACVETGIIDSLNNKDAHNKSRFTLFVEKNEVFANEGITSYEELAAKYSDLGEPTLYEDGLNKFIRYHIIDDYLTLPDFQDGGMYPTLCTEYPVMMEVQEQFFINRHEVVNEDDPENPITTEVYQGLDYQHANFSGWNGVMHQLTEVMPVYVTQAQEVILKGNTLSEESIIDQNWDFDFVPGSSYFTARTTYVGDYYSFIGPYLYGAKYKVYFTCPSYNAGKSLIGLSVNGEKVGASFVSNNGENFVGEIEIDNPGYCLLTVSLDGNHTDANKNNLRLQQIRFVPVNE